MSWYDVLKDAVNVAKRAGNVEIQQSLIDVQHQMLDMQQKMIALQEENDRLREESKHLNDENQRCNGIEHHETLSIVTRKNDNPKIPFCSNCWGLNGKEVRMVKKNYSVGGERLYCTSCTNSCRYSEFYSLGSV